MLTPAQLTLLKTNSSTTGSSGISPTQSLTPEQAKQWIGAKTQISSTPGFLSSLGQQVGDAFNSGATQVYEGLNQAAHPGEAAGNLPLGLLKTGAGVINSATSPLAPAMKPVGDAINAIGDKVGDIPAVQNLSLSKTGEYIQKGIEGLQNADILAGTIAGGFKAPEAGTALKDTTIGIKNNLTPKPLTPDEVAATNKANTQVKLQRVADDWKSPTVPGKASNPASFNAATDILAKSPTTPKFLAEQKLSPSQHIENGRYATADTASALRDTAGKLSVDALRPSLQEADYSAPVAQPTDLFKASVDSMKRDPNITAGDTKVIQDNIQKELSALQEKYPDGMSLTNRLDEGITYAKNGGYKPASLSDNNIAIANRSISHALGDSLQADAPKSLPVADFRQYQSQYYKAADYLDALDTKKAPMSVGQYVAHKGAQVIGATVGHGIGGGILGGVGGYIIGGALEHAIENMALPLRDSFLKNLKITQPDVYSKVVDFLGNEEAARATRLALPVGSIKLGTGVDKSSVTSVPASKTPLPTANPKTGRMQTTYTSLPK